MARPSVTVALLGVGEHERRVLLASISAVSGPALLPADLQWVKVDDAAIVIADVDHPLTARTLDGLQQLRAREVIRFAAQMRSDVDIARPIRMQALIQALQQAMQRILLRAEAEVALAAQQAAVQGSSRRTYRGAALSPPEPAAPTPLVPAAMPSDASDAPAPADPPARPKRTYRGQSY